MDKRELQVIEQLMEELKDQMEYGEDDFAERLGRKKPGIEVVKIEGKMPMDEDMEDAEEMMGEDLDEDMEMGEPEEHKDAIIGSPEDVLKERLMRLRK